MATTTKPTPAAVLAVVLSLQESLIRLTAAIAPRNDVSVEERAGELAERWKDINRGEAIYVLSAAIKTMHELEEAI